MRIAALALLCLCASAGPAGAPSGGDTVPDKDFAVRCGKLYRGFGAPLENAWLIVRNGRVQRVIEAGAGAPPAELPVLDASDRVVMPGIVAADTDLSGHPDTEYGVTPDFLAIDGFDFSQPYRRALSGGVTTAYLAPGRTRLIPGQGSVVKLAGLDLVQRVLAEASCLRITLGKESTTAPAVFEPTAHPTADDPLLPARKQYPSSRLSQLATLRSLFAEASAAGSELQGPGSAENQYDAEPLRRVLNAGLPLRIAAREAADIRRAVRFAREVGTGRLVLEDPYQIGPVAEFLAQSGAAVICRVPVLISASNPGGEDRNDESPHSRPDNPALCARAGIEVALAPARNADLADYLLVAGIAVRYGLDADVALRGITSTAAKLLGVDSRVGTLEAGKDADFLVLSGEPFAIGTMVEKTFVDGSLAFARESSSDLLAVTGVDRILTADGRTIDRGVIVVADGKIKALGEQLAIPYGARVIDFGNVEGAVLVPGFIDAFSSMGLSGEGSGVPPGAADQRIGDVIRYDDPLFLEAARAGLTTVLVSGTDSGTVSGRVTAVKTGAVDRASAVLRETAGIRFVHDSVGGDGAKPLRDALERGKRYIEAWQKYEKAVADWKAGKGEKPIETAAPVATPTDDPVSGSWDVEIRTDGPFEIGMELQLKLEGTTVTGQVVMRFGPNELPPAEVRNGTFEGGKIRLEAAAMGGEAVLEGTVEQDRMTGTFTAGGGRLTGTFEAVRTSKDAEGQGAATPAAGSGPPQKPAVDESLEPIRALLEKRATAVIHTNKAPAILDVVELFEKEQLAFVLHGVSDAIDTPDILGEHPPDVMLGPTLVRRDGKKLINAAATLADRDVHLAIVTGDAAGSRYLPLHAAHAIRYGMDPEAALRALTIDPARMFKIDDRVGSLRRGKDADFVVFSGSPFEMTSRVLLVVCDGRVVHDARNGGAR